MTSARASRRCSREPLADELSRAEALRWGALLHDAAKPLTRAVRPQDGRVTFLGHDVRGAELARTVLGRLRASERLSAHVAALVRHHLRLGFLVHEPQPLSRRRLFGYLRACSPVEVDVTLLSVADRLATRGDRAWESIAGAPGARAGACCQTRSLARGRAARAAAERRRADLRARHRARSARGRGARVARRGPVRRRGRTREQAIAYARASWLKDSEGQLADHLVCASDGRPELHLLQDRRARAAGDDRRRGRADDRLHGHRAGHARACAGSSAHACRRPAER